jgi:hypothetical protein
MVDKSSEAYARAVRAALPRGWRLDGNGAGVCEWDTPTRSGLPPSQAAYSRHVPRKRGPGMFGSRASC